MITVNITMCYTGKNESDLVRIFQSKGYNSPEDFIKDAVFDGLIAATPDDETLQVSMVCETDLLRPIRMPDSVKDDLVRKATRGICPMCRGVELAENPCGLCGGTGRTDE